MGLIGSNGGHRYRWEWAQALVVEGLSDAEIMARMGVSERQLTSYLVYAKRREQDGRRAVGFAEQRTVVERVYVRRGAMTERLKAEAKRRRLSLSDLVDDVLTHLVRDDLFAAVLDD